MAAAPTDTHEEASKNLVRLLSHYLSCHSGGEVITNRALRITGYAPAIPDVVFFRHPKPESRGKNYTDQIPDLTVEILSPSNKGGDWEDKCNLYRNRCPEVWFCNLDGSMEIWRFSEPDKSCRPGELFSSPLFPGLAIDPAWIKSYPEEVSRIEQFNPQIVVAPSIINPKQTKKAQALGDRIAQHFGRPAGQRSWRARLAGKQAGSCGFHKSRGQAAKRIRGASANGKVGRRHAGK